MRYAIVALVVIALYGLATLPTGHAQNELSTSQYLPSVYKEPPTPTVAPPTATIKPTETPVIFIKSHRLFQSTSGAGSFVMGEIVNNSAQRLYDPRVIVRIYNASGTLVATDQAYPLIRRADSGGRLPFAIRLSQVPTGMRYELAIEQRPEPMFYYESLFVQSQDVTQIGDVVYVDGKLHNSLLMRMSNIQVAVTFYDQAGNVVFVQSATSASSVGANGTLSYVTNVPSRNLGDFASVNVQAQGVPRN